MNGMDLHCIVLWWNFAAQPVRFMFKSRESAEKQYNAMCAEKGNDYELKDDFGNMLKVGLKCLAGVQFVALGEEAEMNKQYQLFSTHAQIRLQKAAEQDSEIMEHSRRMQGRASLLAGNGLAGVRQ